MRPKLAILLIAALFNASVKTTFASPSDPKPTETEATPPKDAQESSHQPSIYRVEPWIDGSIIAGSAAATLFAYSNPGIFIHQNCPCDPNSVNSFDRSAIYNNQPWAFDLATATVYATVAVPVLIDGIALGLSKPFAEDAVVFAEVLAVDQALITLLKFSFQRPFPHRYSPQNTYPVEPGDFIAFPSGHTSTMASLLAATAVTVNLRYGKSYWPWIIAGLLTSAVGFEMYYSGEHFPTDVFAGAALGTAVGITVPLLHKRQEQETGNRLSLLPTPGGLGLTYNVFF